MKEKQYTVANSPYMALKELDAAKRRLCRDLLRTFDSVLTPALWCMEPFFVWLAKFRMVQFAYKATEPFTALIGRTIKWFFK